MAIAPKKKTGPRKRKGADDAVIYRGIEIPPLKGKRSETSKVLRRELLQRRGKARGFSEAS